MDTEAGNLRLLRIKDKYLKYSDKLARIWQQEYQRVFISELNNMYVGLTRAAAELYVFVPNKIAGQNNLANLLIPEGLVEMGSRHAPAMVKKTPPSENIALPAHIPQDWLKFLREEFREDHRAVHRLAVERGEIRHYLLSHFGNLAGADVKQQIADAISQARCYFPAVTDWTEFTDEMKRILTVPAYNMFFYLAVGEVFQEYEVVNAAGHSRRLDRLIVLPEEVWVVDYKGAMESDALYQEQVREYIILVAVLYPDRYCRGFLLYLDEWRVEEVMAR